MWFKNNSGKKNNMKKIIAYFIKYPVSVNIIIIAIALFGFIGMKSLNSSFFPLADSRFVNITVMYPGASPQEIEEGVVLKIEDNLRGIVGIDRFTSTSKENVGTIKVEKQKGYDIDVLLADVKNAVDKVPSFPADMEPPVVSKIENLSASINLVVTGENIPLRSLKKAARDIETDLKDKYKITQLTLYGFPEEELEIAVSENKLLAYNLSIDQVSKAVSNSNILTTGGSIKTESEEYLIRANNRFYFAEEIDNIIIKSDASGNIVRLKDVAKVSNKWEENPNRSYYNGKLSVGIDVFSTNQENMMTMAADAAEYAKEYNKTHQNLQIEIAKDPSKILVQRTELLLRNGWQGLLLVIILLSLFLKPRIAFWVAFGIPISFMGMFIVAGFFGVTINVLSLFAMILVIGILVDDGIVIAENIYHHYEKGMSPIQAAIDGTIEVGVPILSAVATTMIAFGMFFFVDGRVGEYFGEVATIVLLTLGVSLFEALLILPTHIAHSKDLQKGNKPFFFNRWGDSFMNWMRDKLYAPVIEFFMEYKVLGFAIPMAMLILTIGALKAKIIDRDFFPNVASDKVIVNLKMPQGTNENITDSIINYIEDEVWKMNEDFTEKQTDNLKVVHNVIKKIGPGTSTAKLTINLLPGDRRDLAAGIYSAALDSMVGEIIGVESIEYGSGTMFGGKPISISLAGSNLEELKAAKKELKKTLLTDSDFMNVSDNDPLGIKEINIKLKENAYLMGFSYGSIMRQIRSGFYGQQVQRLQQGQDEMKVWVRYDENYRASINNLDNMRIVAPNGARIPLSELVTYTIKRGDVAINHLDGKREILVYSDKKDATRSSEELLGKVKELYIAPLLAKYTSVNVIYGGQNREAEKSQKSIKKIFPFIIFIILIVIVFTFRSYSQPFLLLLLIPFSLVGVAWGHWLLGYAVNVLSFLGIIALVGIVVNDGLVLIAKFNGFLRSGMPFERALIEAGKSRFRAIFLTSATTVAGLLPLILFETSRQAQFLKPMAISVAFGIMVATLMTLILLPIFLSFSNFMKTNFVHLWTGKRPAREEMETAIKEMRIDEENEELGL